MKEKTFRYKAFISYSQRDKHHAKRLHRTLEAYRVPTGIEVSLGAMRKLGRFFRDDEEMSASSDLGSALRGAIDDSECLIVICSPRAAQSRWVNEEVAYFKCSGRANRVFAVIVDGTPNAGDPLQECFPPAFRFSITSEGTLTEESQEALGLELRKEPYTRLLTRLVAGLLRVSFDDLWRREQRRRRARLVQVAAASVALFLVVLTVLGWLIVIQAQQKAVERSRTLASAARESSNAAETDSLEDDGSYVQSLRLATLAARDTWLLPASVEAEPQLSRAAHASLARLELVGHDEPIVSVRFSSKRQIDSNVKPGRHCRCLGNRDWQLENPSKRAYRLSDLR